MFSADEHYAGRDPSEGTELCAVVEAMFSLEQVLAVRGGVPLADRLERIAYNALPATLSPDMWAHQYDQQANQVLCSLRARRWVSNGPESNLFGLEPNFGCCTANMHQGWPKLVASLWMATPDEGLAAVAYGPSEVRARATRGQPVTIEERTDYPFREDVELIVRPDVLLHVPAAPAHSVVGRRRDGHGERSAGARRRAWRVPANRARLAAGRQGGAPPADEDGGDAVVSRRDRPDARTARVRAAGWRRLAEDHDGHEAPGNGRGFGLGDRADDGVELRTAC